MRCRASFLCTVYRATRGLLCQGGRLPSPDWWSQAVWAPGSSLCLQPLEKVICPGMCPAAHPHPKLSYLQCRRPEFDPWDQEDPLEKEMATQSNILAWKIPWTQKPGGLQITQSKSLKNWATHSFIFTYIVCSEQPPPHQNTHTHPYFSWNCSEKICSSSELKPTISDEKGFSFPFLFSLFQFHISPSQFYWEIIDITV